MDHSKQGTDNRANLASARAGARKLDSALLEINTAREALQRIEAVLTEVEAREDPKREESDKLKDLVDEVKSLIQTRTYVVGFFAAVSAIVALTLTILHLIKR